MKRVLLKLSGEALAGERKTGFDEATCLKVAEQVKQLVDQGTQVGIVIGGGNFWRGPYQRDYRPQQGGSDWYACHGNELHLRVGDLPVCGYEDPGADTFYLRFLYEALLQGSGKQIF